ncbi:fungal-specific transcription factor domain-containing protein [Annulohypoxylon maeteangense]|uniref:fungal-specific transcription factor domain-containing protein n=1 Tax=Annulohypoxylon maeteangense TaxID=1927788 RepID=UPI002008BD0F|nr:fungal-specific transcription factor domain-containing protein [Annulohypoxylon maeteangense]KAI0889502.1 fungal-specific transcription factor domain-containing protein [Annulohypoxylon maeteangense]
MQRAKRRVRDGDGTRRLFTCTQDGCGKSFSRSEHLHRHQKNHIDGDATCPRCRAHFKRQDLLERHMSRHKQKDEEAGGEGIGTLNTRKRMWKDHDGRIVQKKPIENPPLSNTCQEAPFTSQVEGPISPPVSSNSDHLNDHDPAHAAFSTGQIISPGYSLSTEQFESQGPGEYWIPSETCQPRNITSPYLEINYDEIFQPDTASSFNMPYTTQINYDWLFSLDHNFGSTTVSQTPYISTTSLASYSCGMEQPTSGGLSQTDPSLEVRQYNGSTAESPLASMASLDYVQHTGSAHSLTSPGLSGEPTPSLPSPAKQVPSRGTGGAFEVEFERPLAALRSSNRFPFIDGYAYARIVETIKAARPSAPNGSLLDLNHPLLSHPSLQSYCDLYFRRFNSTYPLIHQATFEPSNKEPLLLLSMILLGATYSEKEAHQLAVCIHDVIRPAIFSHASFNPKPDLWMLQTILLVECLGKDRAGQKQHDMSHLFHGMLINLIRRSDCQSVRPTRPCGGDCGEESTNDSSWRQWVEAEEKKRLALLCFMWDTQHAVLFCQSLCMSAFELKLPLPCNQALWEAPTAAEWSRLSLFTANEPMYLLALKSYITLDAHRAPLHNSLSRIIIFHGLMSIFWDMRRRDQTSLGVIAQGGRWQSRLTAAYEAWKEEFDSFCTRLEGITFAEMSKGAVSENAKIELDVWRTAYVAVYHAAHVLLHSEFLDIQIFAGARHILGRSVQRADFIRSEKVIRRWATNVAQNPENASGLADAPSAAWHASQLLQNASRTLVDFDSMGLFHVPWCLYLATLTIWAFHHAGMKGLGSGSDDDSELVWDVQAEMSAIIDSMVEAGIEGLPEVQGTKRTGGLVWVMAEVLSKVRWGIVHAGVTVLRGLVPWRLIGQFDDATT